MSITVTVNGQSGPSVTATTGDTVGVTVGGSSSYGLTVTQAGTPGGTGPQGPAGPPYTTVEVGDTTTLSAGSSATVTATSTNSGANLTLNFGLPAGPTGANGVSPTIAVGNTTTLSAGSNATVSASTAGGVVTLNFGIPQGASGAGTGVTKLNNLTGSLNLAAGPNVTITATNSSTLTIDSKGLGANDAVDGGFYTGEVVQSITFTQQPQSQNVVLGANLTWSNGTNTSRYLCQYGNNVLGVSVNLSGNVATIDTYSNVAGSPASTLTISNFSFPSGVGVFPSVASNGTRTLLQLYCAQSTENGIAFYGETLRSDDGASSWTKLTAPRPSSRLVGGALGFLGNVYDTTGVVSQSTDGAAWNTRTLPFDPGGDVSPWVFAVGPTAMVGVCGDANRAARSTTGTTWSSVNVSTGAYLENITHGNGKFCALGASGAVSGNAAVRGDAAYTSADGLTWSRSNLPLADFSRITFANGRFIALRNVANVTDAVVSTDGVSWTLQSLSAATNWQTVGSAGNYFAVAAYPVVSLLTVAPEPTSGSANLTVVATASTGATVGYQWQRSTDVGTTWANVANANTGALNVTNVTLNDNGTRYRVLATATGVPSAYSSTALLTVS